VIENWTAGRRRGTRSRVVAGGCAAIAIALTAGCGGAAAPTASAPLEATPITIGLLANIGGTKGEAETAASEVFEVWAAETNATGGIAGHPVELIVRSTRGDSATASAAAEEMIDDPDVAAVVHVSSDTDGEIGSQLAESGLPVVGGLGYNPRVWGALKNWFGITTTFPEVVNQQVAAAGPIGGNALSVVACSEDVSCTSAVPLFEAAAQAAGRTYTGTVQVAQNASDYISECRELIARRADFVQLSILPSVGARIASDCRLAGYDGFFGASASSVTSVLYDTPGIRLAGGLNAFPWWVDAPPVQRYRAVMQARGVDEAVWAQPTATALWATGELFKKTMSTAAGPTSEVVTRQAVLAAYGRISGETLDGLLPQPMTFTADRPAPPVDCYWLYQYENGEFRGGFEPTCPS
jgi:branched-chain amino acid transport system substrate-binding protein